MKTVLVVDDMPENVLLVRKILALAGFRVEQALSGEEALNKARREMPDLVLLDLRLGEAGMSGYDAARRLRALPGADKAVLVALSGGAVIDDEEKARGCHDDEGWDASALSVGRRLRVGGRAGAASGRP